MENSLNISLYLVWTVGPQHRQTLLNR